MDRATLISISYHCEGEYRRILRAIKEKTVYEEVDIPNCITILDEEYPKEFYQLKYPPLVLYYRGSPDLLKKEKISVVGSRKPCDYARKATKGLCLNNPTKAIVSGLAKGIDAEAHRNARYTIGILGCGIDVVYPAENRDLYQRLEKEGLILSEYPGKVKPCGYHFPFRNRLISALGSCLYIMQSSSRSGTMSTLRETLELGKDVKVLPYDAYEEAGENNNLLIREGADIIGREEIAF